MTIRTLETETYGDLKVIQVFKLFIG